jgi:hypothetical protein
MYDASITMNLKKKSGVDLMKPTREAFGSEDMMLEISV